VVVVTSLGAALGVAAIPHAHVHGVDWWLVLGPGQRDSGEQVTQSVGVYGSMRQSGVEAAPSATMGCLEAEVYWGRDGAVRAQEGIGKVEEGIGSTVEALIERGAERAKGVKSIEGPHDPTMMHSPAASRTPQPSAGLKRKSRR
jgi:hypothetical protein